MVCRPPLRSFLLSTSFSVPSLISNFTEILDGCMLYFKLLSLKNYFYISSVFYAHVLLGFIDMYSINKFDEKIIWARKVKKKRVSAVIWDFFCVECTTVKECTAGASSMQSKFLLMDLIATS